MSKKNTFDKIMDMVDENCKLKYQDFKEKLYTETGYTDMNINKVVVIITDGKKTLKRYFVERKIFFAAKDLVSNPKKSIVDIALEYNYSDQSSFTRTVKNLHKTTPGDIRAKLAVVPDERLVYQEKENRLESILRRFGKEDIPFTNSIQFDYFEEFEKATAEYGFDTSVCCAISDVAEKLEMPFGILLEKCFEAYIYYKADAAEYGDFTPKIEAAIGLGITDGEDFDKICEANECEWYDVNQAMVDRFYGYDVQEKIKESIIPV